MTVSRFFGFERGGFEAEVAVAVGVDECGRDDLLVGVACWLEVLVWF